MTDPRGEAQQLLEELIERNNEWWRNESHCQGEMRELGVPDDADAPKVCMGDLYRIQKALRSATAATPANARAVAHVVLDNLPYLENLIDPRGHESGLLKNHPKPCAGHDFCLMRQAQKGADAIRAAATLPEAPQPAPTATCPTCKGSGDVQAMTQARGPDDYEVTVQCPECNGTGAVIQAEAPQPASARRGAYTPFTEHEIEMIRACLDDGTYTKHEQSDFGKLCNMALEALRSETPPSGTAKVADAVASWHEWRVANPDATMYEAFLHAATLSAVMPERWIPISERRPTLPGDYLAAFQNGYVTMDDFYGPSMNQWWLESHADYGLVTHWMPLPAAPSPDGNEEIK